MTRPWLPDLIVPRDGRTRQSTSVGRDPDRGGTFGGLRPASVRVKRILLAPGETHTLASIAGPGLITRIWLTHSPWQAAARRDLVMRLFWDGEPQPSVESPLGDFFGAPFGRRIAYATDVLSLSNGGYVSEWPMPFAAGAEVQIANEGASIVDPFFYQVTYTVLADPPSPLRLHAQWRRENPTRAAQPYRICEARGSGHYVGCHLSLQNREWWLRPTVRAIAHYGAGLGMLEGWLTLRVDGEAEPSVRGTGTEDEFNGAWYDLLDGTAHHPRWGCTVRDLVRGRVALYRFDTTAPVPFTRALDVTIDHGLHNGVEGDYASVAYWYQAEPHAPFPALPSATDRRPSSPLRNVLQFALAVAILAIALGGAAGLLWNLLWR